MMMKDTLDSLRGMGDWQVSADKAFGELRQQADAAVNSIGAMSRRVE